jgi:pimeloyl-ACP methyl ester carboxylesterase
MKAILSKRKRLIRIIGIVLILLLVTLQIILPIVVSIWVIIPLGTNSGEPPPGFAEIEMTTPDGVQLAAWYAEPQNGAVIVLVHGAGRGRESVRPYAAMLRENGFGVLAMNLRGFGDSEGRINRLGWNGTKDIGAAVDYLAGRDGIEAIGGLGLSLGGEVLLGAASQYPGIQAIVAEGATFRSINESIALPEKKHFYNNFSDRLFTFAVGILSGDDQPDPTLLESVQAAQNASVLLIAAGKNKTEVAYNELFHETVPDRTSLWVIPNVNHTGGFSHDPDLYEEYVIGFFNETLLRLSPTG